MVVFIICIILLIIILITIITITSSIKLKLTDFKIEDYKDLKEIVKLIKDKEYIRIFNYLDFILTLELCALKKIPILKFQVSDDQIAGFLRKQIRKHKLKKEEREVEQFAQEDKKEIEQDLPDIDLESLNLSINLGTEDASITALLTSIVSILISVAIPFGANKINSKKYNYEITPIYLDRPIFNIDASLVLSMPTTDVVKLIR